LKVSAASPITAAGALGEGLRARRPAEAPGGRRGGHQHGAEAVLAQAPGEAEEGVDEDRQQQHQLQVEHQQRGARRERHLAHELGGRSVVDSTASRPPMIRIVVEAKNEGLADRFCTTTPSSTRLSRAVACRIQRTRSRFSHREAPFITTVPKVDGTDFYMFRSYEPAAPAT
jgi:hypothetical protein